MKRMFGAVAATVLAFAGLAGTVTPASAAGGGCLNYGRAWTIGVCSSDNGVRVSGDVYITKVGTGSPCTLYYGIYDETLGKFVETSDFQSCYSGRHPEIHTPKVPGHKYYNYAVLEIDGVAKSLGKSKTTT